jgi:large subunit ribosomal protein L15e
MVKGAYSFIREAWKKPDKKTLRQRMIEWRKGKVAEKVDKPLRLDRARALGYKAKKGFIIVRVKIKRGGRKRPKRKKGRRSKRQTNKKVLKMNYKWIAEQRAARKFKNLEVLNSYWIGKDGIHYFYEVIMIDPSKPEIKNSKHMKWINKKENKKRVFRGLTRAGKKSRGMGKTSRKTKTRPSVRARGRKGK